MKPPNYSHSIVNRRLLMAFALGSLLTSACYWHWPSKAFITLNIGNNENGYPPKEVFVQGENIYAVAGTINIEHPAKLNYVLTAVNVTGVTAGQELRNTTVDVPDSRSVHIDLRRLTIPGEYKLDLTLIDKTGKPAATKSGTFNINPK